ncbi:MAG: FG-GAP-like repeat-containing protein [Bacteroidota bacterium]
MKNYLLLSLSMLLIFAGTGWSQTVSFTNQSELLGNVSGGGFGSNCAVDMNGDNLDDVVRVQNNGINVDYQQADGTFEHVFIPAEFNNSPSWSICAGDVDQNGQTDLLFGGGSAVSFVMANEDGTAYTEYLQPDYIFSQRSTFFDIDKDGDLDAFVCHDVDLSHPYINDGTGIFVEDQDLIHTVPLRGNYAAIWVDYNNDSHTDLYITKCAGGAAPGDPERTNGLYRNNGDGTFTEVGAEANMDDNAQSWATVFEDFDNDGDFDAFIVNHDFENRFKKNNGDGTFTDIIQDTNIDPFDLGAWENASGDFNNDGFVDILTEHSNDLYLNNGNLTFTGQTLPFDDGAIGDFNNDGFLDVVRGNSLWINDGNANNWIKINTKGLVSNIDGIGSRVEIYGDWGMQIREVRAGQSFSPMSTLTAHFGIGESTEIDSVVVRWPSGINTVMENPAINTNHEVVEASCTLAPETISVIGNTALCEGETVQLLAPGGYDQIIWSIGGANPSIEVSQPGSYGLTLFDEEGCASVAANVQITRIEDTPPVIAIDGEEMFCKGGEVTLSVEGAINPVWTNGMTETSITVSEAGTYNVVIDAQCSEEGIAAEEAIEVIVLSVDEPVEESVEVDPSGVALLTVSGQGELKWYDAAVEGTLIGQGASYTTDVLTEDATYYVDATQQFGGGLVSGAKSTPDGPGGIPSTGAYNYFNAYESFNLQTVDVLVPDNAPEGPRTVQLFDSNDNMLASTVVDLVQGLQTIELNFTVPVGNDLSLRCPENNLFRNNGGVNYPYPIGDGLGEVTRSFWGAQYYYYFYNWQIGTPAIYCTSDRTAVSVTLVDVAEIPEVDELRLFPNPAQTDLQVELMMAERASLQLILTNALGQQVYQESLSDVSAGLRRHAVDVSQLPAGVYQLQLSLGDRIAVRKVVVE